MIRFSLDDMLFSYWTDKPSEYVPSPESFYMLPYSYDPIVKDIPATEDYTELTYSFPNELPIRKYACDLPIDALQKNYIRHVFDTLEDDYYFKFTEINDPDKIQDANMQFVACHHYDLGGSHTRSSKTTSKIRLNSKWMGYNRNALSSWFNPLQDPGPLYAPYPILYHEVGHGLGLEHSHIDGEQANEKLEEGLKGDCSVMSYDARDSLSTFGPADEAILASIYGAKMSHSGFNISDSGMVTLSDDCETPALDLEGRINTWNVGEAQVMLASAALLYKSIRKFPSNCSKPNKPYKTVEDIAETTVRTVFPAMARTERLVGPLLYYKDDLDHQAICSSFLKNAFSQIAIEYTYQLALNGIANITDNADGIYAKWAIYALCDPNHIMEKLKEENKYNDPQTTADTVKNIVNAVGRTLPLINLLYDDRTQERRDDPQTVTDTLTNIVNAVRTLPLINLLYEDQTQERRQEVDIEMTDAHNHDIEAPAPRPEENPVRSQIDIPSEDDRATVKEFLDEMLNMLAMANELDEREEKESNPDIDIQMVLSDSQHDSDKKSVSHKSPVDDTIHIPDQYRLPPRPNPMPRGGRGLRISDLNIHLGA